MSGSGWQVGTFGPIGFLFDPSLPGMDSVAAVLVAGAPFAVLLLMQIVMVLGIVNNFIRLSQKAIQGNSQALRKLSELPTKRIVIALLLFSLCFLAVAISYPLGGANVAGGSMVLVCIGVASPFFLVVGSAFIRSSERCLGTKVLAVLALSVVLLVLLLTVPQVSSLPDDVCRPLFLVAIGVPSAILFFTVISQLLQKLDTKHDLKGLFATSCCLCVALPFFVVIPIFLVSAAADEDTKASLAAGVALTSIMAVVSGSVVVLAGSVNGNRYERDAKVRVHLIRSKLRAAHSVTINPQVARIIVDNFYSLGRTSWAPSYSWDLRKVSEWLHDGKHDLSLSSEQSSNDDDHLCLRLIPDSGTDVYEIVKQVDAVMDELEPKSGCCGCGGCPEWVLCAPEDALTESVQQPATTTTVHEQLSQLVRHYGHAPGHLTLPELRTVLHDAGLHECSTMPDLAIFALSRNCTKPTELVEQLCPECVQPEQLCRSLGIQSLRDLAYIDHQAHSAALGELSGDAETLERELFATQWGFSHHKRVMQFDLSSFMSLLDTISRHRHLEGVVHDSLLAGVHSAGIENESPDPNPFNVASGCPFPTLVVQTMSGSTEEAQQLQETLAFLEMRVSITSQRISADATSPRGSSNIITHSFVSGGAMDDTQFEAHKARILVFEAQIHDIKCRLAMLDSEAAGKAAEGRAEASPNSDESHIELGSSGETSSSVSDAAAVGYGDFDPALVTMFKEMDTNHNRSIEASELFASMKGIRLTLGIDHPKSIADIRKVLTARQLGDGEFFYITIVISLST